MTRKVCYNMHEELDVLIWEEKKGQISHSIPTTKLHPAKGGKRDFNLANCFGCRTLQLLLLLATQIFFFSALLYGE